MRKKNWEGKEKGFVVKDMKDDAGRIEGERGGRDGEVKKKKRIERWGDRGTAEDI